MDSKRGGFAEVDVVLPALLEKNHPMSYKRAGSPSPFHDVVGLFSRVFLVYH